MDHSISKVVFAVALSAVALGQNACTDDSTTGGTPTPSEASCSSDSDCTGDMQCIANTCSTRLRNGSACSSNDMSFRASVPMAFVRSSISTPTQIRAL